MREADLQVVGTSRQGGWRQNSGLLQRGMDPPSALYKQTIGKCDVMWKDNIFVIGNDPNNQGCVSLDCSGVKGKT